MLLTIPLGWSRGLRRVVRGRAALGAELRAGSQARVAVRAVLLRGRAALGAELRARRDRAVAVRALDRRRLVLVLHGGLRDLSRRWRRRCLAVPLAGCLAVALRRLAVALAAPG